MDEHHEGEAPAGPSSAVRSRFWAGLNHASDRQSADRDDDQGLDVDAADPGGTTAGAHESSARRDQRP